MKVFYSRVSSSDGSQKHDRQLTDVKGFDYVFSDSCSGGIDFYFLAIPGNGNLRKTMFLTLQLKA